MCVSSLIGMLAAGWPREQLATLLSLSHWLHVDTRNLESGDQDSLFIIIYFFLISQECFQAASHNGILFVSLGWLKMLQYGRTGSSSFTNNEPSCPSDVAAVHSLNGSERQRRPVFCIWLNVLWSKQLSLVCIYLLNVKCICKTMWLHSLWSSN